MEIFRLETLLVRNGNKNSNLRSKANLVGQTTV